jgi:hypothetical protein
MSIRTQAQLGDFLAADLIWRKKEMTQYRFLLEGSTARVDRHGAILRGCVTLLYAHWEGYVKSSSFAYLEYLSFLRLQYRQLAPNFLALASRTLLRRAGAANTLGIHIEVVKFFREGLHQRSSLPTRDGISTRSNLSADVLEDIVTTLGLDFNPFATKRHLIDEGLLASRNTIAHGEVHRVTPERYEELQREVLGMLEEFKTQIENAVALRRYAA